MSADSQEIVDAQAQLGKALDRARAGEDKELATQVREVGEQLARLLNGTIRLTRIHDPANAAFDKPVAQLVIAIRKLLALLGAIHLVLVEDQVYVNDIRVRFDATNETGTELVNSFRVHGVGGISFHAEPEEGPLRQFLLRSSSPPEEGPGARLRLQNWLNENGLATIELAPPFRFRVQGEREAAPIDRDFQRVYNGSSGKVAEAWDNLASDRMPNPLPMRRLVTDFIDLTRGEQEEELLTAITDTQANPHVRHTLHVTALSLLIGRELGLPEASLSDLGVAAMFHDMGYSADEDGYPPPFERHTSAGARVLLRQRGFHEARIRRLLTCMQHHRNFDDARRPHLYARIVRIADDYDTLTRPRTDGPLYAPPDAVAGMKSQSGTVYDPVLMQIFVNRIGRFPPGTVLELSDSSWVVVMSGVRSQDTFSRPLALRVRMGDGSEPEPNDIMDLAEEGKIKAIVRPR